MEHALLWLVCKFFRGFEHFLWTFFCFFSCALISFDYSCIYARNLLFFCAKMWKNVPSCIIHGCIVCIVWVSSSFSTFPKKLWHFFFIKHQKGTQSRQNKQKCVVLTYHDKLSAGNTLIRQWLDQIWPFFCFIGATSWLLLMLKRKRD